MRPAHLAMLGSLATIWGTSYVLQVIALRDLSPAVIVTVRLALCAVALLVIRALRGRTRETLRMVWEAGWPLALVGLGGTVGPMLLVAWAQQHVESGMVAVLTSSSPLFAALLAWPFLPSERVSLVGVAGLVTGFAGVVLLLGAAPQADPEAVLGLLASAAAALLYGVSALYAGGRLSRFPADVLTIGASGWAVLFGLPLAIAQHPTEVPGWPAIASVVGLGLPAAAIAFSLYYALIAGAGASRALLVQYLTPGVAVVFGALTLGERFTTASTIGLVLVLAGVAVATSGTARARPA